MNQLSLQNSSPYLSDLNPAQFEAVCWVDGPLLVFAGAGSGKTRVLTHRIAHLVTTHGIELDRLMAVTFTNKAALEMKQRVAKLLNQSQLPPWIATFHSLCVRILRVHAKNLGYSSQFAIYDTSDSLSAMRRTFKRLKIDSKIIDPKSVISRIDRAKNAYIDPDTFRSQALAQDSSAELVAELYKGYQEELLQSNAMDFGDLLCNVVTLFKLDKSVHDKYKNLFKHILVDEYQDTNKVQYMLLRQLADNNRNICVVGDDDQSIYAFRGATIENILKFGKDFPDAKVVTLSTNYRSTKNILCAANEIISHNEKRQQKQMVTPNAEGAPISMHQGYTERDEAEYVVCQISTLERSKTNLSDIAIFYRTNSQSRAIEEALCEAGIPYEIFGGFRFYDRKEIKDILAYFRLLNNPLDNEAFFRVINSPSRGIGATTLGKIVAYANNQQIALLPAVREILKENHSIAKGAIGKKLTLFAVLMDCLEKEKQATEQAYQQAVDQSDLFTIVDTLPRFLSFIVTKTGYVSRLKQEDSLEAESRIENIYELITVATEFAKRSIEQGESFTFVDFLDRASLASNIDKLKSNQDSPNTEKHDNAKKHDGSVSLMTVHLAKGLEFDVVFLIGMEEGIFPHNRSLNSIEDIEEERRLCYVGVTRAGKKLFMTRCLTRQSFRQYNNWHSGEASRFLSDIPPYIIETSF